MSDVSHLRISFGSLRSSWPVLLRIAILLNAQQVPTHAEAALEDTFKTLGSDWRSWSPREAITPHFRHDPTVGRQSPGSLVLEGAGNAAAFGAWKHVLSGIKAGTHYQFQVHYRTENIPNPLRSVIPRLLWKKANGQRARPPEFISGNENNGPWTKVSFTTSAPLEATHVEIQLGFGFAPKGRVWWDDLSFREVPAQRPQTIRVATIHHRPRGTLSPERNLQEFGDYINLAAKQTPDIICLPEGITVAGTGKTYIEVSESVPGPTTQVLGKLSKAHRCYLVAGIYEKVDDIVYNTAVLIDRDGELVGSYRKTHLPREEWEGGITPGDSYPIFNTDFGKIALMICWDVQFPEPARAMAAQGADLLFLPIWGGNETLTRARAIENHVYLVSSSYDMRSFILDPTGQILGEATTDQPIAVTTIELDRQYIQSWIGNMKHRTWKERRPDIPVEPTGTTH